MRALSAFVACLALASCTSAPKIPPSVFGAEARGHSLHQTDILVVNVSNLWFSAGRSAKSDGGPSSQRKVEPAGDTEALRKEFVSGFREVKPDARIVTADEHLKAACFASAGLAEREPWSEPVRPSLDSPACQAALQAGHVHYLVSVHAWLTTDPKNEFEAHVLGIGTTKEIRYHFEVVAAVFDVATGSKICVDRDSQYALGDLAVGIILVPAPLPVPVPLIWGTRVDAQAYWKHAAWQAGARAANCFVAPTEAASAGTTAAASPPTTESQRCGDVLYDVGDMTLGAADDSGTHSWCLLDAEACPLRCNLVSYEACMLAKPDARFRCVPGSPSKPARP